ncbi:MAG TPA: patatin-like phospholipase family protein [Acholeplasmataceae bacterium]|nr:patatin-like phospholipase family protein [Acholeplasmataceae bacterium]
MKVGLMLGGGGVFGAYQVGVIRALIEEDLLSQINVMSGSSIGAINILMLMAELSIDEIEELWTNLDNEMIFKGNAVYFKNERKSLFNTTPLYDLMTSEINISRIKNSKIRGYATIKEVKSPQLKYQVNYFHGEKKYVLLNESKNPFKVVRASASVPMLFGSTKIDDSYYVDGGMIDNNPVDPLLEEGCELILAVPIASRFNYKKYSEQNITIIDFKYGHSFSRLQSINILKSMYFNVKFANKLKGEGYKWAKEVINLLKKRNIIVDNQFRIDNIDFKYYNLKRLKEE